ncbi:hypothetical protein [Sporolactobacillus terrae]|uniref:hypothetical protein n=1 Tax=Sporolactobacillus terrae TaxID=269673 RepID=UPI00048F7FF8|nr:hypothetical protein [Sporolactobacillus terrae]
MKASLKNSAGVIKQVKVGFSWTTFFFGLFPALFRGDLKWFFIMLIAEIALGSFTFGLGASIVGIVFSFIYNKIYIKELLDKNWRPASKTDEDILRQKGIYGEASSASSN